MITFPLSGESYVYLQFSGDLMDSVLSLDSSILTPPTPNYVHFTAGATGLKQGMTLIGGTSTATAIVEKIVITSGTLGTSDAAGILYLRDISGTWVIGENMNTAAPATVAVARSAVLNNNGQKAKSVFLQCETNNLRICWSGYIPTNAAATPASQGILFQPNENLELSGWGNVTNLKFINAASGSNGVLNVIVSY